MRHVGLACYHLVRILTLLGRRGTLKRQCWAAGAVQCVLALTHPYPALRCYCQSHAANCPASCLLHCDLVLAGL